MRSSVWCSALVAACLGLAGLAASGPVAAADDPNTPWVNPSMPPRCNDVQLAAGDVADCTLEDNAMPTTRGWGTPPFPAPVTATEPATPDGTLTAAAAPPPAWAWLGWAYNGSPALAAWEQAMAKNASAIGPIKPGKIETAAAAQALFEGFLREVLAGGFTFKQFGGYAFRCTSTTRKDCRGLAPESLSYHAFGLAVDLDPSWNPEQTARAETLADGTYVSACAEPVVTNLPAWVVRTAQRWGLYWGGYGWSRRCTSPDSRQSSIFRDPMHVEFRGSPQQAAVIVAHNATVPAAWIPSPLLAPPPTPAPTTATAAATPTVPASADWTTLARGARGPAVLAVQKALRAKKVAVSATGYFGPATEKAVKTFQRRAKLARTGKVDRATASALGVPTTYARR